MQTGKRLSLYQLAKVTGVSRSSITTAAANQSMRVDFQTLDRLLAFFEEELGETLTVADLLEYESGPEKI